MNQNPLQQHAIENRGIRNQVKSKLIGENITYLLAMLVFEAQKNEQM